MGTRWQLLGSAALKPRKQPPRRGLGIVVLWEKMSWEEVAVIFEGTWVRNGWPLATNSEPFKAIERSDEGASSKGITSSMGLLVKLGGAMTQRWLSLVEEEISFAELGLVHKEGLWRRFI